MSNKMKSSAIYLIATLLIAACSGNTDNFRHAQPNTDSIVSILSQLSQISAIENEKNVKISMHDYGFTEKRDTSALHLLVDDIADERTQSQYSGTLILVTHITHCRFCLDELDYWQDWITSGSTKTENPQKPSVLLVITGATNIDAGLFVNRHGYTFNTLLDTEGRLDYYIAQYATPFKLFIDRNRQIDDIRPMGINENLNRYAESVLGF